MKNDPSSPLYLQLQQKILDDISHLSPHDRIPSRVDLMKRYGVTRTTIEKAVSELMGKGYLYALDGSGTYVSDRKQEAAEKADLPVLPVWGVVVPSISDDFYPEIVRGIEDVAQRHGTSVLLCNTDNDPVKQHEYLSNLARSKVKGVIIVPAITKQSTTESFQLLQQAQIPFVFCNRVVDGMEAPRVVTNNFFGAYQATKYVIGLGKHRIAFAASPQYSIVEQRYHGYLAALHEAGIGADQAYVRFDDTLEQERAGYEAGKAFLSMKEPPDAVICFNDEEAKGIYTAAAELSVEIGSKLSVVGFGDTKICEMLPVKLTSVRYPTYRTGEEAAVLLCRKLAGEPLPSTHAVVLQPELIIRSSCGES